eukprot:751738-Hanusia_phi.AAC.1
METPLLFLLQDLNQVDKQVALARREAERMEEEANLQAQETNARMWMLEETASASSAEAEKLRKQARGDSKLLEEAADEIERLAARLQEEEKKSLCAGERNIFLQDELREMNKLMTWTCRSLKEEILLELEDITLMAAAWEEEKRRETRKEEQTRKSQEESVNGHEEGHRGSEETETTISTRCHDVVRRSMPEMKTLCDEMSQTVDKLINE